MSPALKVVSLCFIWFAIYVVSLQFPSSNFQFSNCTRARGFEQRLLEKARGRWDVVAVGGICIRDGVGWRERTDERLEGARSSRRRSRQGWYPRRQVHWPPIAPD